MEVRAAVESLMKKGEGLGQLLGLGVSKGLGFRV